MNADLFLLIGIVVAVLIFFGFVIAALKRYKRCPSDKILVIYGKVGGKEKKSARCVHGGASFVWPVFQAFEFLDLTPMSINVDLRSALSKQNIRVNVPSQFTVGIATVPQVLQNAAERLLGLSLEEIKDLAKEIILGQLRLVIAQMDIEEINANRDKFLTAVTENVEGELNKIGLRLINVNITDITDESGYIEALGKRAAAEAINNAKREVAEKDRDGEIGQAKAQQDQRVQVADANAKAVSGENEAKIKVANSNASREVAESEASKKSDAARLVQSAKAKEEGYKAEKIAEEKRAERDQATQHADKIVPAEIEKQEKVIAAQAEAEQIREIKRGEADGLLLMFQAEAEGKYQVLMKKAEGLSEIVKAAGNDPKSAVQLLIADEFHKIIETYVSAIQNIKIDKITVWDTNANGEGNTSTAGFLQGMFKSIPGMDEVFKMANVALPEWVVKETPADKAAEEKEDSGKADKEE